MQLLKWQIFTLAVLHCLRDTLAQTSLPVDLRNVPELVIVHPGDRYTYGYYCDDSSHDVPLYTLRNGKCVLDQRIPPSGHCTVNRTLNIEPHMSGWILMYGTPGKSCDIANSYGRRPVMISVANCTDQEGLATSSTSSVPAVSPTRVNPERSSSLMASSTSNTHIQSSVAQVSSTNSLQPSPPANQREEEPQSVDSKTFTATTAVLLAVIVISWVLLSAVIFYLCCRLHRQKTSMERTGPGLQQELSTSSVGSMENTRVQMQSDP